MAEIADPSLSRADILTWINDLLKLNLTKIEQLGTGAVHCQILDVIYPGKIPLHKVNWRAKFEYEFVYNFKILQQSFTKFNIPKYIDVEKLIKAKYQDNLEFAQWVKKYFLANCNSYKDYDPVARRGVLDPDFAFMEKTSTKPSTVKETGSNNKATPTTVLMKQKSTVLPGVKNAAVTNGVFGRADTLNVSKTTFSSSNSGSTTNLFSGANKENETIMQDLNNILEKQKFDKNPQLEVLKAERDFYYAKLKDIDHVLDVYKDSNVQNLITSIRDIIYMVPEKIAIVCEDGNVKIKNKNEANLDEEVMMSEAVVNTNSSVEVLNHNTLSTNRSVVLRTQEDMMIEDELNLVNNG